MQRQRGLSMLEVMIVLAIILILTTIAYPSYAGYIAKTRRIEGQVALVETMQQQERYFMRNNTYVAFGPAATDPRERQFKWWSGANAAQSAYQIDGYACAGGTIADCIELRATPGTAQVDARFHDTQCGTMTLDSAGRRGASGSASSCWP